ncbi:MAG: transposase [Candidatus Bathyarchaeia archaeon]
MKQRFHPDERILGLMESFRQMTNICIWIGLENDASSLKRLSLLYYKKLRDFQLPSCYKLCSISKAAGILAARKKSIKRGYRTKTPYLKKPLVTSCYGFKIVDGKLVVPVARGKVKAIPLNTHTVQTLAEPKIRARSFTLSRESLSICIGKEVESVVELTGVVGVDRNLNNLTVGNSDAVTYYEMSKASEIAKTTRDIVRSFKRNDTRTRSAITGKYGERRKNRVRQLLHRVSKRVVESALENRQGIVFEGIRDIRRLYRRGNGQGRGYRARMNDWPFHEVKRQVEYKAAWVGVPVIMLSGAETRGTSRFCPRCGERLQSSKQLSRKLWCQRCREMFDRDLVAVLNICRRGRVRFARSEGVGVEAMVKEPDEGPTWPRVILRVDPTKLTRQTHESKS